MLLPLAVLGTTLDKIEIPLDDDSLLIDTPGIIHRGQMAHYLEAKDLKLVSPKKKSSLKLINLMQGKLYF